MKARKVIWKVVRSLLMVLGIVVLLAVYIFSVRDLPATVYTNTQQEFLAFNEMRAIRQVAPTLNFKVGDEVAEIEGESRILPQLPWQKSKVKAILKARFEEQDGISVAVYDLSFNGEYDMTYSGDYTATVELFFPFPANLETYHEVTFLVDGEEPADVTYSTSGISWWAEVAPGDHLTVDISYQAEGASSFSYGLVQNQRTDIDIIVDVVGLSGSEIARGTLPESAVENTESGETWSWHYDGLIADRDIRLNLPKKLNYAQRVAAKQSDFRSLANTAPLLVVALLGVLYLVYKAENLHLRLESFLLIGFGTVLFFPLLTFMSAALPQVIAALLAFGVVTVLILLYIKRATASHSSMVRTALMLAVFLGLFAIGIISPWQGLFFTLGGLVLVGTFMTIYAGQALREEPPTTAAEDIDIEPKQEAETLPAIWEETAEKVIGDGVTPVKAAAISLVTAKAHCPHCGRELAEDFDFCPGCGKETGEVQRCAQCGYLQVVVDGDKPQYCVKCGTILKN